MRGGREGGKEGGREGGREGEREGGKHKKKGLRKTDAVEQNVGHRSNKKRVEFDVHAKRRLAVKDTHPS